MTVKKDKSPNKKFLTKQTKRTILFVELYPVLVICKGSNEEKSPKNPGNIEKIALELKSQGYRTKVASQANHLIKLTLKRTPYVRQGKNRIDWKKAQ